MTYCCALRLDDGLVFLADTRTNAGVDNVSTFRKLHVFQPGDDRVVVIESAGNLATTQEVIARLEREVATGAEGITTAETMFDLALHVGRVLRQVIGDHKPALDAVGADATATLIVGGRVGGEPADVLLVYPEGNCIRASEERPFLQIGESKYGKFLLELATEVHVDLRTAAKIALSSMVSTARANLSVGPPYDLAVLPTGQPLQLFRLDANSKFLADLDEVWRLHLLAAIRELPMVDPEELARAQSVASATR
jgi:putative proteasome-type protease